MTSIFILSILIATFVLYAHRLQVIEIRKAKRESARLRRENETLALDNAILLDDLDAAVEVIAFEGAKRRHPATPRLSVIAGGK